MVSDPMSNSVIIKTKLEHPPPELVYCWREPYERFPVREDGTVEGLSIDHPRFVILQYEWKLEVTEVVEEKPQPVIEVKKEVPQLVEAAEEKEA